MQINSYNEADDAGSHARQNDTTTSHGDVKVEEDGDGAHGTETIGYIAVETGVANQTYTNGMLIQAGVIIDDVTHNWYPINYPQYYSTPPVVISKMMTEDGADEADEAMQGVTETTFQVSVEESPSHPPGTHTDETFGWLASDRGKIYGRQYLSAEPSYSFCGDEENLPNGSFIANKYTTRFKGYLLMKVEKNTSSGWQTLEVVVNDTQTQTLRIISGDVFDLSSIWNATPWNTDKHSAGVYRVYVSLTDKNGTVLESEVGKIEGYGLFNITKPPVEVNITEIRVYNITGNPNPKTYTGDLEGSGINTTFTLYSGNQYRIEIEVMTLSSSGEWNLSTSNFTHENLDPSWEIDEDDIWYSNSSNRTDDKFVGGLWNSGIVKWNSSSLDGTVQPGGNVTFYYIVNVSASEEDDITVTFLINDTFFTKKDVSVFHIIVPESVPPFLYQGIYNLTKNNVTRGETLVIYARWNETISDAIAEFNSTSVDMENHTITLPSPNPQNWTNYTIQTTSQWKLGAHMSKIYAADEKGNWNGTLPYLNFTVWGLARVSDGHLNSSTIDVGDSVMIECKVEDQTLSSLKEVSNYPVRFYNSTSELGISLTNSSGWASFVYTDESPGVESIICNITENETLYYKIDEYNEKSFSLTTKEYETPKYWDVSQNLSIAHKGDYVLLSVRWTDNHDLNKALLSTNASSTWQNVSSISMNGTESWANFSYQIPISMQPGYLAWRQYGNDSFDNQNVTGVSSNTIIEVWGWSEVGEAYLTDDYIYQNEQTTMVCRVIDSNSTEGIGNYTVHFYNSTNEMGINVTNSTGWTSFTFTDSSIGDEDIICNITTNTTLMYNVTENNEGSDVLHTASPGADITPPFLIDDEYNVNDTYVLKGKNEAVLAYAHWNETINNATIIYNSTNSTLYEYEISGPYTANWTNYTILTNGDWVAGVHVMKIQASDPYGNWNTTLPYKTFPVWGYAGVYWQAPTGQVKRGMIKLECLVKDMNNSLPIEDYKVEFYNPAYLGYNMTNSSGIAVYYWDASSLDPGPKDMTCYITHDATKYYRAEKSQDEETIYLMGSLNTTIVSPENETSWHKGDTLELKSVTKDENGITMSPDSVTWYDSSSQVANGENTTWQIPANHDVGEELIKVSATKQWYYDGNDNRTIYIWGWSRVEWVSPNDGFYGANEQVELKCRVSDKNSSSAISNYPVNFYRDDTFLATSYTDINGYATYNWNTDGLPDGSHTLKCNISDNTTLYYNASEAYEDSTIIHIDTKAPNVENETLQSPSTIHYNETVNLTVNAYDANGVDKVWARLGRPVSHDYVNVSLTNLTITLYNFTSDEYSYELGIWNATFFANDTAGNQNESASTLTWNVYGWSNVTWVSPQGGNYSQGSSIELVCKAYDVNTSVGIGEYPVHFYVENSTNSIDLGSSLTNSSGHAIKYWDTSGYNTGVYHPKCNITSNSTVFYDAVQPAYDNTTINLTAPAGRLIVELILPVPGVTSQVGQNRTFRVNATVKCEQGDCGNVQGTVRYNASSTNPDTPISTVQGATPFWTDVNPRSCPTNPLSVGEYCNLTWEVNATGDLHTFWKIGVLFEGSSAYTNHTRNATVEITIVLIMSLSNHSINQWIDPQTGVPVFSLPPNTTGAEAENNPIVITIDESSNDASGLYIKGTDLVNITYHIYVGNVTWNRVNTYSTGYRLSHTYQEILAPAPAGTSQNTYFWIDVPWRVAAQVYNGTIYIMANATD